MAKTDEILGYVIGIKEDVAGIKEHLKTLNGKVIRHEKALNETDKEIDKINITMARWSGAIVILFAVVEIVMNFIF